MQSETLLKTFGAYFQFFYNTENVSLIFKIIFYNPILLHYNENSVSNYFSKYVISYPVNLIKCIFDLFLASGPKSSIDVGIKCLTRLTN